jgi:hypothetical protein
VDTNETELTIPFGSPEGDLSTKDPR